MKLDEAKNMFFPFHLCFLLGTCLAPALRIKAFTEVDSDLSFSLHEQ